MKKFIRKASVEEAKALLQARAIFWKSKINEPAPEGDWCTGMYYAYENAANMLKAILEDDILLFHLMKKETEKMCLTSGGTCDIIKSSRERK